MTLREAESALSGQLTPIYGEQEAAAIADLVLEHLTGLSRSLRSLQQNPMDGDRTVQLDQMARLLLEGRPVQYVLGEAWFAGLRLRVDARALIPRPETEELVQWVVSTVRTGICGERPTILDAGTGSGCIALALTHQLPQARVLGFDRSAGALELARENAARTRLDLEFFEADMLQPASLPPGLQVDLLVSNPPYIPASEAGSLAAHVHAHEPHAALFAPAEDPLLFYRALAELAQSLLHPAGFLFVETHADFGEAVDALFRKKGYLQVDLRQDMQGLPRMVRARMGG